MMLSTSRTKTNNKNNAHFKLLISSFLSGRVLKEEVEESLRKWKRPMPRKYTKKTNRGQTPIDVQKRAAGALRQSGKLRQSAR